MNATLLRNRIFATVITLQWVIQGAPHPLWLLSFWKGRDLELEQGGHHGEMKAVIVGMCLYPKKQQRLPTTIRSQDRGLSRFSLRPSAGTNSLGTLDLDFCPPVPRDNKFQLFQGTQVLILCYSSPWKLIFYWCSRNENMGEYYVIYCQ